MNNKVTIKIDDHKHVVPSKMLGSEIKNIANIPLEVRLVFKIDNGADTDIENTQEYELKNNMKFVSDNFDAAIEITIDRKKYTISKESMTGAELLQMVNATPDEYKLVREEKVEADKEILPEVSYEIYKNEVFFTVLRKITNGGN